jgi:hypothetical protein
MEIKLYKKKGWRDQPSAGSAVNEGGCEKDGLHAIALAKRCPEYRLLRREISGPAPSDVWSDGGLWFVVFDMNKGNEDAVAMFVIDLARQSVLSVQRINLEIDREIALVTDVRQNP